MRYRNKRTIIGRDLDESFFYDTPRFDLADIAFALAGIRRFCGRGITVATHCIIGAEAIMRDRGCANTALAFLWHDAAEAFIADVPLAVKQLMREDGDTLFDDLDHDLSDKLYQRFLTPSLFASADLAVVKEYDTLMSDCERGVRSDIEVYSDRDLPQSHIACNFVAAHSDLRIRLEGLHCHQVDEDKPITPGPRRR